jgi:hypothetical protein
MQADYYQISYRLMEISKQLHDLSREIELATCSTSPGDDTDLIRQLADSVYAEAKHFRYMGS